MPKRQILWHIESGPTPDLFLARPSPADPPLGGDALLAIEVAVTSQAYNRSKASTYARGEVQELWLLDVPGRCLELHCQPQPRGRFAQVQLLSPDREVTVPGLGLTLRVEDLLPEEPEDD